VKNSLFRQCSRCGKRGAYWYGGNIVTVRCRYCKASVSFRRNEQTIDQAAARLYLDEFADDKLATARAVAGR
jgi:hypothetical protein